MQHCVWRHEQKVISFPKKVNLRITKNYNDNALLLNRIQPDIEKILRKNQWLLEESINNLTDSDYPSNHRRSMGKESQGNTTVCRFLQGIQFHTQRKRWTKYYSHMFSKKLLPL